MCGCTDYAPRTCRMSIRIEDRNLRLRVLAASSVVPPSAGGALKPALKSACQPATRAGWGQRAPIGIATGRGAATRPKEDYSPVRSPRSRWCRLRPHTEWRQRARWWCSMARPCARIQERRSSSAWTQGVRMRAAVGNGCTQVRSGAAERGEAVERRNLRQMTSGAPSGCVWVCGCVGGL